MRLLAAILSLLILYSVYSQQRPQTGDPVAIAWADSVYKSLSDDERIAQLMVVRLSSIDLKTNTVTFYDKQVSELIRKYNIGSICLFQGSPVKQVQLINDFQQLAKTPIMVCIDAEWGLGQRMFDSILPLPKQMMLGAMKDTAVMWRYGKTVANQLKRMGIHVNYAPVADVNNNPSNPVINDRSFGENKYDVAALAVAYMRGMQDNGVMACAKHFPGHGDVVTDSHLDLPVINKSIKQLDSLELYPFRALFNAGVGSAMMAHLFIPSIDSTRNMATSLSAKNVTTLLREKMKFDGLTFTDALDMQAVEKFFPKGESSVESVIAGNDMLCIPADIPLSIQKIKQAVADKRMSWSDIEKHCKKVLVAKYNYVVKNAYARSTSNLVSELNAEVPAIRREVAEKAITLVRKTDRSFFPLDKLKPVHYIAVGAKAENQFAKKIKATYNADVVYTDLAMKDSLRAKFLADSILRLPGKIIVGIHNINRKPMNNFDIGRNTVQFVRKLQQSSVIYLFGNAYAAANWCDAPNLVVCYEDDDIVQSTAADLLEGKINYKGSLPVSVCKELPSGTGISYQYKTFENTSASVNPFYKIDSISIDAISKRATPGCVVLIAKDGVPVYANAYGHLKYDAAEPVSLSTVYDIASVTKVAATTLAIMKLYDEGKIDLQKSLGNYMPSVAGSNKAGLIIRDVLLHEAGVRDQYLLKPALTKEGYPARDYFSRVRDNEYFIPVADSLFVRNDWPSCMFDEVISSPLGVGKYVYSDFDFMLLGKLVEEVSGMSLDRYIYKTFYSPMGLQVIGYNPFNRMSKEVIAPTEIETRFRNQLIHATVHDPNAAAMGGIAGHAGLFSNAQDLLAIMQMLLDGGVYQGRRYVSEATVKLFTSYNSANSRRGLGFDKPECDNPTREEPYPAMSASDQTFGHTGFTGTAVWADPSSRLVYIFLSNRTFPSSNNLLNRMNVRGKILEAAYQAVSMR